MSTTHESVRKGGQVLTWMIIPWP